MEGPIFLALLAGGYLLNNKSSHSVNTTVRQPQFYEEFAEKNLQAFGHDVHIVLVIRKPSDFLNSIYMQTCIHEKPFQKPEHFFLEKKDFTERLPNSTFS